MQWWKYLALHSPVPNASQVRLSPSQHPHAPPHKHPNHRCPSCRPPRKSVCPSIRMQWRAQQKQPTHARKRHRCPHTSPELLRLCPWLSASFQTVLNAHPDKRCDTKPKCVCSPVFQSGSHSPIIFRFIVEVPPPDGCWWSVCILCQKPESCHP